jgi:hypothetical protein
MGQDPFFFAYGGHKFQVVFKEYQVIWPIYIVPNWKKSQRHAI